MLFWIAIAATVYLVIGVMAVAVLSQTPYAECPLWTMVLLWPLFLIWG